ncbi:MAG: MFS transporter, partial [Chloroflexi bacterium]|nr:MFS transporter [Chloroflexota bacterium]
MQRTPDDGDQAPDVADSARPAEAEAVVTPAERTTVLWLSNASHAANHFQNGMLSVLWVPIMEELGFGLFQLGVLQAIRSTLNSVSQGLYGFLTPFFRRTRILAFANMLMGLGVMLSGFAFSFWSFVGSRVFAATGSSAQHPVGASLLSGYFPRNRGTILALNASVASVGSFLAPLVATAMLSYIGWRQVFFVLAGFSVAFGLVYLFFSERRSVDERRERGTRSKLREGFSNYRLVLKNRNILAISLVMMVGAGGRGGGVNDLYLIPWMRTDLLLSPWTAAWAKSVQQLGGIVGPLGFGWLSDRLSRTRVLQASLV